jgi:uncharacterized protein (DUF362 family)
MTAGIRFKEKLDGYFGPNIHRFHNGEYYGIRNDDTISCDVTIEIDSIDRFIGISKHEAGLSGTISLKSLSGEEKMEISDGRFNMMAIDPQTGHRTMRYNFNFNSSAGKEYYFSGYKDIFHDKAKVDLFEDLTTVFFRVYEGEDDTGSVYGSGIMYFRIKHLTPLAYSMEAINCSMIAGYIARAKFFSFFMGETVRTYAKGAKLTYNTRYENLILSGKLQSENEAGNKDIKDFFFFSGEHDKDFPWGDGETMSDVGLLITDHNGTSEKYGITNRSLGGLRVDLKRNIYSYKGELYKVEKGNSLSFSEVHNKSLTQNLKKIYVEFEFSLDAIQYSNKVDLTFEVIEKLEKLIPDTFEDEIKKFIPSLGPLGVFISPFRINIKSGTLRIVEDSNEKNYFIDTDKTLGEGEIGDIHNLFEPSIYYHYVCGVNPCDNKIVLKINSGTLRNERQLYFKDLIDKAIGKIFSRNIKKNLVLGDSVEDNNYLPQVIDNTILSIVNDHYPTATLERRIVKVENEGQTFYAMEEYINQINLASINSNATATVAVSTYKDIDSNDGSLPSNEKYLEVYNRPEKLDVLDDVIEKSGFFDVLEKTFAESGKSRDEFAIIIKPNFMFTYNRDDKSTFTDPTLAEHLLYRIEEKQFKNVKFAEAGSTLSTFFQNRDVKSVAKYIGFKDSSLGKMLDMTEGNNTEEIDFGGRLGNHPVNRDWANADFRISFAKNKTHSYAFYTLTMKNIYGALSKEFKYRVYHQEYDDIYGTTIDFIDKYKIHFGFIDGIIGADGPFGIFADPYPQLTMTIIGGEDIVAVDWVGAGKMGIDPMLSKYMQEAVKTFGKPRIKIVGDSRTYKYWANIPRIASIVAHQFLDKHYLFGFIICYITMEMDSRYFPARPTESEFVNSLRRLAAPIRELVFKEPDQHPSELHKIINQIIFRMMQ